MYFHNVPCARPSPPLSVYSTETFTTSPGFDAQQCSLSARTEAFNSKYRGGFIFCILSSERKWHRNFRGWKKCRVQSFPSHRQSSFDRHHVGRRGQADKSCWEDWVERSRLHLPSPGWHQGGSIFTQFNACPCLRFAQCSLNTEKLLFNLRSSTEWASQRKAEKQQLCVDRVAVAKVHVFSSYKGFMTHRWVMWVTVFADSPGGGGGGWVE